MKTVHRSFPNLQVAKRLWSIGLFGLLAGLFLAACQEDELMIYEDADMFVTEAKAAVEGLTVKEAKTFFDTSSYYLLLDVREPQEFHPGYIPNAVNIPRGMLEFNIDNEKFWDDKIAYMPIKSDPILVYCKKGSRAILAAHTLKKMGFTDVRYIIGGFKKWELTFPNDYQFDEVETHEGGAAKEEEGGC